MSFKLRFHDSLKSSDTPAGNRDDTAVLFRFPDSSHSGAGLTPESADELLELVDSVSRRIDDLARELNLLGHFPDDDDDPPRAA